MEQYVFSEPKDYTFENRDGHSGKVVETGSTHADYLFIECDKKLTVSLIQHGSEFAYLIMDAENGYFELNGQRQEVRQGDLVVVPPGTKYTFGGRLNMLLTSTPPWQEAQEEVIRE